MIKINHDIQIAEDELDEQFVRASGPGGQNVNKVSSAVRLRFNARASSALPEDARSRLIKLAGDKATLDGDIVIMAQRYRSQPQNRADARARLAELIRTALERPKTRTKTRPSKASKRRRLESKRQHGDLKRSRGKPGTAE